MAILNGYAVTPVAFVRYEPDRSNVDEIVALTRGRATKRTGSVRAPIHSSIGVVYRAIRPGDYVVMFPGGMEVLSPERFAARIRVAAPADSSDDHLEVLAAPVP